MKIDEINKIEHVQNIFIQTSVRLEIIENNFLEKITPNEKGYREARTTEEHLLRHGAPYRFLRLVYT